jgi:hypothetical protein
MGRCIKEYSDVLSLDIVPSESFTRCYQHSLEPFGRCEHMEKKLANVQEAMYPKVTPRVHFLYGWLFD